MSANMDTFVVYLTTILTIIFFVILFPPFVLCHFFLHFFFLVVFFRFGASCVDVLECAKEEEICKLVDASIRLTIAFAISLRATLLDMCYKLGILILLMLYTNNWILEKSKLVTLELFHFGIGASHFG